MADSLISRTLTLDGLLDHLTKTILFQETQPSFPISRIQMDTGAPNEPSGTLKILFNANQYLTFFTTTEGKIIYDFMGADALAFLTHLRTMCQKFNLPIADMLVPK